MVAAGTSVDVGVDRAREPLVRCGTQALTHAEVRANAARIASGMAACGVVAGDRVAIVMRNNIAFPQVTLAAGLLGAVPVPINWHWKGAEIEYVLSDSGAKVVVVQAEFAGLVASVLPQRAQLVVVSDGSPVADIDGYTYLDDWLATQPPRSGGPTGITTSMIYTSGTTGRPKGVLRQQADPELARERVRVVLEALALQQDFRTLVPAPLYHTAPHMHMVFSLQAGIDLTIMPRFDAEDLLRTVERERIEHIQCVPTMFIRLLQLPQEVRNRYDLRSLRAVVHAAAACPPSVKRDMIAWLGPIIHEYYGGTEVGAVVACNSEEWLTHPGTVGKPVADAEVRAIGQGGAELPRGEIGQLYIKPPRCQPPFSYHGNDTAAMHLEGNQGFVTIGDIGYLDDDGFVYITDRASDMVISGGVNIYPVEIENCLQQLDGVLDSAVFGVPDPEFGERLVAHVQRHPGADITLQEVEEHLRASLAGYKVPKTIIFDPDLPRDDSGKLLKRLLRDQYRRGESR